MRAILIEYPPYGPWDHEREALELVGGTLQILEYESFAKDPPDGEILLNAAAGAVSEDMLGKMPSLEYAVSYGIGLDWIDGAEATRRGIQIVNMPVANAEEVATHTIALLLACARRLLELDGTVRNGQFDWPRAKPLYRLRGRRLGLLAFGKIPRRVAALAAPFGLRISAYDPFVPAETVQAHGVEPADLDHLLGHSNLISVHLPSTPQTRGLLDSRRLQLLPPGAIVVVTSRGDVYDADALARELECGHLAAAGLDVFPEEPLPVGHNLARLPNVLLTPHVAGYSEDSIRELHETAAAIISAVGAGHPPPGLVGDHT